MSHDHEERAKSTAGGAFGPAVDDFEQTIRNGGVVLFPSDTVYGLACDPKNPDAIERLYRLKGRPADKSAAVMFFDLHTALAAVPELGHRTQGALHALMPGKITALVPNRARRFPLACRADPDTLGLRIVDVPELRGAQVPVLQSSANPSGGADARSLSEVAPAMRAGADLVINGGELPGVPSTVLDLRAYDEQGVWSVLRRGAVDEDELALKLEGRFRFDPSTYGSMVTDTLPGYERLQQLVAEASGHGATGRILDLGMGTGETAARVLERHPEASVVGVDESPAMLDAAERRLGGRLVETQIQLLQEPLPAGPFDLVVSALAVHHLDGEEKAELFRRVRGVVAAGGRFVLGDVVVPEDGAEGVIDLTEGYDKPSTVRDQIQWLRQAGFEPSVHWAENDLAVLVAAVPA